MRYLIFGTGDYYQRYKNWFIAEEVAALLDNATDKQGTEMDGIPIISPEEGITLEYDAIIILSFYVIEMKQQLISLGVCPEKIYHFFGLHKIINIEERERPLCCFGEADKILKYGKEQKILLLSHDLTLGGPAIALFHAAVTLKKYGFRVIYGSMLDGPLRKTLQDSEIPVVVDENLQVTTMQKRCWTWDFSLVICNTIHFHVFLSQRKEGIPVIWWLHDSLFFYGGVEVETLQKINRENLNVVSVGVVPALAIRKFLPDISVGCLLYGVRDTIKELDCRKQIGGIREKVVFITVGYIETRKGQDLIVQALSILTEHIRKEIILYFVGQDSSKMARQIKCQTSHMPEIIITGVMEREQLHELMKRTDVMICPSREDPMPTVVAEAMMHSVPCIVSDAAGTAVYIHDGEDGLTFESGDVQMLAKKLEWCVINKEKLRIMGKKARKIYEEYFSMPIFERCFMCLLKDILWGVDRLFSKYKNQKIAIYGLSTETEKILRKLGNNYKIVGILDSFRVDGEIYNKNIISFDDAVNMDIKLIIVAARPGSCRSIAKKIGKKCLEKGIALMDIRGMNLLDVKKVSYCFDNVNGVTKAGLTEMIRDADVVSFDLFDTLVMRQTLYSDDVAQYVNCRLKENGIYIEGFCQKRLESEKELSQDTAPALIEIYQNLLNKLQSGEVDISAAELAELEWNIDFSLLVPRIEVCELFRQAVDSEKRVYIISDTYYNQSQLSKILEICNVTGYVDILSSSDYGMGKTQGLYQVLKDDRETTRYLHIGDDIVADIENAHNWGFETCRLFSGLDLIEYLGGMGLIECVNSLSDHLKVGIFIARIFNSPFQFENMDGQLVISDVYDVGYQICAPVISDFVFWFYERVEMQKISNIWFGSRDGYLLRKLYRYLLQTSDKEDNSVYFLTSRTAAVRAGIRNEEDIRYVDKMKFSGTLEQNLKKRFGIEIEGIGSKFVVSNEDEMVKYKYFILENSRQSFENYQKYIDKLNIKIGDIAFFDFVAKGTTQMYVQRLISNHIKGFYFFRLEAENMKNNELDINSFYEQNESNSCTLFEDYYILETLITAPHPSVIDFDENGEPIYASETRSDKDILCFDRAQEGIMDYFKTFLRLCPKAERMINRQLDEIFLKFIHKIRIMDSDFLEFMIEDPFFNRTTKIIDLL